MATDKNLQDLQLGMSYKERLPSTQTSIEEEMKKNTKPNKKAGELRGGFLIAKYRLEAEPVDCLLPVRKKT